MNNFKRIYVPGIRSVGEIVLAVYLLTNWHEVPTWLIYAVALSFLLDGILSALRSVRGALEDNIEKLVKANHNPTGFTERLQTALRDQQKANK